ncbi:MAG: hypothetical protein K2X35_10085 [Bryobacteraceae bacterium]|nr:hypothetical protein [Bryobacteraceae bacterium]
MGWFSKKKEQPATLNSARYRGKPLLILLENYVLDCIGCLPSQTVATVTSITQQVYGGGDDWKTTLRSTLHLDESLDENLRQMWTHNQEVARQAGQPLSPEDFARMVVDQNFSSLVD